MDQPEGQPQAVVLLQHPMPLARHPVRLPDGSLTLDFRCDRERAAFKTSCVRKVEANCLAGARSACASRVLEQAAGPWWRRLLRLPPAGSAQEQEGAQDAALDACLLQAAPGCTQHAQQFCNAVVEASRVP